MVRKLRPACFHPSHSRSDREVVMTLGIHLLGQMELALGETPLPLPATARSRSLLAYLVTCRERPHPREWLADLFWPDRPRDKALRSLSTALWHTRRVLPPDNNKRKRKQQPDDPAHQKLRENP